MGKIFVVHGAKGTGSVAVEAALTLIGAPFHVVETPPLGDRATDEALARVNPMRQVPTLSLPNGDLITESAAILIWLAETNPAAELAPVSSAPDRAVFLQWMAFVSSAIYALYWVRDDPSRLSDTMEGQALIRQRTAERITACWAIMESRLLPGRYLLGDTLTVLDLYVAVVSRWEPRRKRFYAVAPRMGECVRRVDSDPRLEELWAERMPPRAGD